MERINIGDAASNFQPRREQWEAPPTTDNHVQSHPEAEPYDLKGGAFPASIGGFMAQPNDAPTQGPE
ncbi:MAG: hypothetical protein ACLP4W_08770 [Mycobacterium sp.]|uniref:hypothetical protein n=1 Tax=Mycobacterium sp. TaxID=1785 RepID=UPI003F9D97F6